VETFLLLETVLAAVDIPEDGIVAGDVGTIVDIYTQRALAYEVEFNNADGSTRRLVTVAPDQIRRPTSLDVLTTRQAPASG
jgi:hypothetical protein